MKRVVLVLTFFAAFAATSLQAQYSYNQAATFSGSSSYVAVPNSSEISPTTAITVEAWVKPTGNYAVQNTVYGKNFQTSTWFGIFSGGRLLFVPRGSNVAFFGRASNLIPANQWTHIAGTYDGTTTSLYINGVLDTSTTSITGAIGTNTDSLFIGADRVGTTVNQFFIGNIDEVRVWNVARTAAQISRDRFSSLAIVTGVAASLVNGTYSGLLASWRFNGNANDESGSLTIDNGLARNITYLDLRQKAINHLDYNNTLLVDGANGYCVSPPNPAYNATTALTLEAWVRPDTTATASEYNVVNKSGSTNRYNYAMWVNKAGVVWFQINSPGSIGISTPAGVLARNKWSHVAATYNSANGKVVIYANGDSVGGGTIAGNPTIQNDPDSLYIGGIGASTYAVNKLKGQIDEVRIWNNVVRSRDEIRANMYKKMDFTTSPLPSGVAVFGFDGRGFNDMISALPSANYLLFQGTARMTSAHIQTNVEPTSPILRDDAGDFAGLTYVTSRRRMNIPDNNATGVIDSVFVSATGNVTGSKLFVLLNHTFVGDLNITLTGPTGVSVAVHPNTGGGNNDMMCIFSDNADSIASTTGYRAPFSPFLKPANPLSTFNGTARQGWWKLKVVDNASIDTGYVSGWGVQTSPLTDVAIAGTVPESFELFQNYPNPFNPSTTISYALSNNSRVSLKIFDLLGREVATLVEGDREAGTYKATFNATNFASGVYFARLNVMDSKGNSKFIKTNKLMLVK